MCLKRARGDRVKGESRDEKANAPVECDVRERGDQVKGVTRDGKASIPVGGGKRARGDRKSAVGGGVREMTGMLGSGDDSKVRERGAHLG